MAARAPLANQEHHILSALQRARNPAEVLLAVNRLPINLKDNIATGQADIFGKAVGGC